MKKETIESIGKVYEYDRKTSPMYYNFNKDGKAHIQEGQKLDSGKLRFDLIPTDVEREIARVFTLGSAKYGDRNWEKGISPDRLYAASRRHLSQYILEGENDSEMGTPHLAHAIVNLMMMLHFDLNDPAK